jgi:hypothetical protein
MIDFPTNPTLGFTFQSGNTIYKCVGTNPAIWSATIATAGIPDAPVDTNTYGRKGGAWSILTKTSVGLDQVDNTSDANKPISTATATALAGKEPSIAASDATKYWRGDKTWQTLNSAAVGAVAKAGDTMTGMLTIAPAAGSPTLLLNKPVGAFSNDINSQSANRMRWLMRLGDDVAEGGSNVGSNFVLHRYADDGSYLSPVLTVYRSTGDVAMNNHLSVGGTGDAISAGAGNISTQQMLYAGTPGVRTIGPLNADGALSCASGMGMRYDGANANFLGMGSGTSGAWTWQWNRSTGGLNWLGSSAQAIFSVDGSGNTNFGNNYYGPGTGGCGGRFTSNAGGDVAALYASQASSGIYTEGNGPGALRTTNGGVTVTGAGSKGVTFTTYAAEGGYNNVYALLGNPAWNTVQIQLSHQGGVWAGWRALGGSNEIQFVMSNGGAWGSITAAAFNVASDERGKEAIAPLVAQHANYMAIRPISWKVPTIPMLPDPAPQIENVDGSFVQWPAPMPLYDTPDKVEWGFSAQNLSTAAAAAVVGDVTRVDSAGKPIIAGVNPVPIIAMTVLEVQELWNQMAALQARVTALGG